MSAFVFSDHPIEDLIRRNLNIAAVLVRAAGNRRGSAGAEVAGTKARQAYDRAQELVRALRDELRTSGSVLGSPGTLGRPEVLRRTFFPKRF